MKPASTKSVYVAPIAEALKNVQFWLTFPGNSSLTVAAATVKELRKQGLPEHIRITPNKRRGKRVAFRGRRHYQESYSTIAYWLEDALVESALFTWACVIRGQADFRIADYVLHCRTGDIVLFPPGIPRNDGSRGHFEENPAGKVSDILWMNSQSTGADGVWCWICRSEGTKHWTGRELGSCWIPNRFCAKLFEGLGEEIHRGRKKDIIIPMYSNLISLLRDEIQSGNVLDEWGRARYTSGNGQNPFIEEALSYIQENIDINLTIADMARRLAVSPATFTRYFKIHTGKTFSQYQTTLRLKIAEEMLLHSQDPIRHICGRIGLRYGRLWELFHKRHGCSPSEFRKQNIDQK